MSILGRIRAIFRLKLKNVDDFSTFRETVKHRSWQTHVTLKIDEPMKKLS